MDLKLVYSWLSTAITLIAFAPYIWNIYKGKTRPHSFSWIIWGITTLIVFFAQVEAHAGVGAWPTGISAVITFFIAFLAIFKTGKIEITRTDWAFFVSALVSIPIWYLMSDPLWAVALLTLVDLLGFGPTMRKAYKFPFEESTSFFALFTLRNIFGLMALEIYSVTNMLFHSVMSIGCLVLIILIIWRRKLVSIKLTESQ